MARFDINQDSRKEYRWTFKANNGETVAVSSEGYTTKANCKASIEIVKTQSPSAPVYDNT